MQNMLQYLAVFFFFIKRLTSTSYLISYTYWISKQRLYYTTEVLCLKKVLFYVRTLKILEMCRSRSYVLYYNTHDE